MRNEPLEHAIGHAGLSEEQLADLVVVDQKTVERWLAGRTPHARTRAKVARALGVEPHELWPDADPPAPPKSTRQVPAVELLGAYPGRDDPDAPDAVGLIAGAKTRIDLLDVTLHELLSTDRVLELLAEKAQAGVQVRVLLADPASIHLVIAAHERDGHSNLTRRPEITWQAEQAIGILQPLLALPGVQARGHVASRANSILRADEQMRVALHLWGAPPEREPILHLEHHHRKGLFAGFARHYELIWHDAAPLVPDPGRYPPPDREPERYRSTDPTPEDPGWEPVTPPAGASTQRRSLRRHRP